MSYDLKKNNSIPWKEIAPRIGEIIRKVDSLGDILLLEVLAFKSGILDVVFSGGCQGCCQSTVTAKQEIEKLLKQRYPQINEVRDVTQHNEGTNPYFT